MTSLFQRFSDIREFLWVSLFPVTYLLHIVEEYWGGYGFSTHMLSNSETDLSPTRFLVWQTIGLLLMVAGLVLAIRLRFRNTMLAILSAVVLSNGAIHLIRSIANTRYDPGLVTGIILWIPLGLATFYLVSSTMSRSRLVLSIAIGLSISGAVEVIAMRGGTL